MNLVHPVTISYVLNCPESSGADSFLIREGVIRLSADEHWVHEMGAQYAVGSQTEVGPRTLRATAQGDDGCR